MGAVVDFFADIVRPATRHETRDGGNIREALREIDRTDEAATDAEYARRINESGWEFPKPAERFNPRKVYDGIQSYNRTIAEKVRQRDELDREIASDMAERRKLQECWLKATNDIGCHLQLDGKVLPPALPKEDGQ